jgi:hypothetical protein
MERFAGSERSISDVTESARSRRRRTGAVWVTIATQAVWCLVCQDTRRRKRGKLGKHCRSCEGTRVRERGEPRRIAPFALIEHFPQL